MDYQVGYGKPPVGTRFKKGNRANPSGRPRGSKSLATLLRRALDAPAVGADGKRRSLSKRELMIRGLVERSAGADLAATKPLFEMMRRADPRAIAAEPDQAGPLAHDALARLKERLARLAPTAMTDTAGGGASDANPSNPAGPIDPPSENRG